MAGLLQIRLIGPIWKNSEKVTEVWIGDPSDPEGGTANDLLLAIRGIMEWKRRREQPDEQRHTDDAAHRDGVGEIHSLPFAKMGRSPLLDHLLRQANQAN